MLDNYNGKHAYRGDIVTTYEIDRKRDGFWHKENRILKKLLKKYVPASVLDLPVGTGRFFNIYKRFDFIETVVGSDISEDMISYSRQKVINMHLDKKITLKTGDAESLDIQPLECIVCFRLAHLLPDNILSNVITNFTKITTKYIFFQIYDLILEKERKIMNIENIFYTIFNKIKNKIFKKCNDIPWQHIENFSHKETDLHTVFNNNHLLIKAVYNLDMHRRKNIETRIYVLEKV
jgi:SAM-dependent methyltransferase